MDFSPTPAPVVIRLRSDTGVGVVGLKTGYAGFGDMIEIRTFEEKDWKATWKTIEPVFRAGTTYAFAPDISEQQARKVWIEIPTVTFVAVDDNDELLGTYYIKPNHPGNGAHVCNCGYIVAENARGKGIASQMCDHSQREAASRSFRAMQYNLVVSTNEGAVRLWKRHGFDMVGTLPEAFRHPHFGFVDAFVLFKQLERFPARLDGGCRPSD